MALALKRLGIAKKIIAVDANNSHCEEALSLGIVDEIGDMDDAIQRSELIILAVPVDVAEKMIIPILDKVEGQVVMDAGSTKYAICKMAFSHINGGRFVATHPMWGTEFSGPAAAVENAFNGKAVVICDKEKTDVDALHLAEKIYGSFGMHILYMDAKAHDIHAAYISHVSHITSFALANTVLEKEKEDDKIFEMASGGFESTVRLAKSNPSMWVPIFLQNKENVLDVLQEHISQLEKFRQALIKADDEDLQALILQANRIKRILK